MQNNYTTKLWKSFECVCSQGFTGVFCEHQELSKSLIYTYKKESSLFDGEGSFRGYTESIVDDNLRINSSCSTLLYGNTLIFGGGTDNRQVCKIHFSTFYLSITDFDCFWVCYFSHRFTWIWLLCWNMWNLHD